MPQHDPLRAPDADGGVCPKCNKSKAVFLPSVSATSVANYFRCPECGNVWTVPKSSRTESE